MNLLLLALIVGPIILAEALLARFEVVVYAAGWKSPVTRLPEDLPYARGAPADPPPQSYLVYLDGIGKRRLTDTRDDLLEQAARARAAGADIVVAHVHWGTEYDHLPSAEQVALADALTASPDVDVVLGEHAHVVQPITKVHGKWVVYGLGNMVAQNEVERPDAYEDITVDLDLAEQADGGWRVTRAAYVPTQWNHYTPGNPIRIVDAAGSHLASVRSAVNGVGGNRGLVEERLPR